MRSKIYRNLFSFLLHVLSMTVWYISISQASIVDASTEGPKPVPHKNNWLQLHRYFNDNPQVIAAQPKLQELLLNAIASFQIFPDTNHETRFCNKIVPQTFKNLQIAVPNLWERVWIDPICRAVLLRVCGWDNPWIDKMKEYQDFISLVKEDLKQKNPQVTSQYMIMGDTYVRLRKAIELGIDYPPIFCYTIINPFGFSAEQRFGYLKKAMASKFMNAALLLIASYTAGDLNDHSDANDALPLVIEKNHLAAFSTHLKAIQWGYDPVFLANKRDFFSPVFLLPLENKSIYQTSASQYPNPLSATQTFEKILLLEFWLNMGVAKFMPIEPQAGDILSDITPNQKNYALFQNALLQIAFLKELATEPLPKGFLINCIITTKQLATNIDEAHDLSEEIFKERYLVPQGLTSFLIFNKLYYLVGNRAVRNAQLIRQFFGPSGLLKNLERCWKIYAELPWLNSNSLTKATMAEISQNLENTFREFIQDGLPYRNKRFFEYYEPYFPVSNDPSKFSNLK